MTSAQLIQVPQDPHDLEAEASVLGAILLDPGAIDRIAELVCPEDFYRENHGQILRAALHLHNENGTPIDGVTLPAELEQMGVLDQVGGRAQLALLQEQTPTAVNVEHYARRVRALAEKRAVMARGARLYQLGSDPALTAGEAVDQAEQETPASVGTPWDPPIPLGAAIELPRFPLEILPRWLGQFVQEVAEATQTPADLGGMLGLGVLGACSGGHVRLRVRPGWVEALNLYTVVTLESGERKSAVFDELTRPLAEFERERAADRAPLVAEARARKKVLEKALDRLQNAAARATPEEREEVMARVQAAARELEAEVVPPEYQLLADDATPEITATLLAEQNGRLAIMSPEGGVFGQMAGRYGGRPNLGNLDVYLKGHSGDLLRVNRHSRGPEFVERPALTLSLAIQPEVLRLVVDEPGFRGRGLLARFLYSMPVSRVGGRAPASTPVSPEARDGFVLELRAMARSLDSLDGAELITSPKAEKVLVDFSAELEPRLGERGDLAHVKDWGGKLTGAVARIAGLLHLASNLRSGWGDPVSGETAEFAVEMGRYLIPHALTAFDLMDADPTLGIARRVLQWIEGQGARRFSRRDCFNAMRRRLPKDRVDELDPVLALLEAHGFVRGRKTAARAGAGRPKSPTYDVHPSCLSAVSAQSAEPAGSGNSADIADSAAKGEGSNEVMTA